MTDLQVRQAVAGDIPVLLALMDSHARYEGAEPITAAARARFPGLLADQSDNWIYVLVSGEEVVGYAAFNLATSTWRSARYLHMDCLYIDETCRGLGGGLMLVKEGEALARTLGITTLEWQTPVDNEGAIRFYERCGATAKPKLRFTMAIT